MSDLMVVVATADATVVTTMMIALVTATVAITMVATV